jgi:bifunctional DNA-binding transcriptional regulator/antitoxin component of YhaV-PrlF toxin-antitoxin module
VGYQSKVQVIQRGEKSRQFYLICPAPMAEALELEKGEDIEWVIEDRRTLVIRRLSKAAKGRVRRDSDAG